MVEAFEKEKTAAGQRQVLAKIQLGLIAAQDIGDEKLATVQALTDLIEDKSRLLKHDAENLDFGNDEDEEQDRVPQKQVPSKTVKKSVHEEKSEKGPPSKRRKNKPEKGNDDDGGSRKQGGGSRSGVATSRKGKSANRNRTRPKGNDKRDDSDNDIPPVDIDPDEPTYCLCEQVRNAIFRGRTFKKKYYFRFRMAKWCVVTTICVHSNGFILTVLDCLQIPEESGSVPNAEETNQQ